MGQNDMTDRLCSLASLRSALNHLYEPRLLLNSPLVGMLGIADRTDAANLLRHRLIEAIESLQPPQTVAADSDLWRNYDILHQRYVQQNSQQQVADQLGLSIRHVKREQRRALEALALRLREQTGILIDIIDTDVEAGEESDDLPANDAPPWLKSGVIGAAAHLADVLPPVLALVAPMAAHHSVTVRCGDCVAAPAAVHPGALRQILLSLIALALKRSTGGTLLVASRLERDQVETIIQRETLHGAPDPSAKDSADLAVSRQLVTASGGRLSSVAQGNVLAYHLYWPLAQLVPILVVDDNVDTLRLMEHYVQGTRYHVLTARDADEALALAQVVAPRAIVLDVMMPEVDGWELLGRLKQHPQTEHIPIIACTILAQEELAESLGVDVFLRKPISAEQFLTTLNHLLLSPALPHQPTSEGI